MFDLENIIRKNILELEPYSTARSEYTSAEGTFMDANENPFGEWNRYPDPYQQKLKQRLGEMKGIAPEKIFIGNGSDEIIDLVIRIFCRPEKDKILTFTPTYGMYKVAAAINAVEILEVPLDKDFQIDMDNAKCVLKTPNLKVVFVCSPNNPTGNCLDELEMILQQFSGILVIDEAYIDFAKRISFIEKLEVYPNLIVMQTLSKAWGLAAVRIGIAYASASIITYLNKTKPPYNVSKINQDTALKALLDVKGFEDHKETLLQQRAVLEKRLVQLPMVLKVYPSDANFLLVETIDANKIYDALLDRNVIVRNRNQIIENCIRVSIGSQEENEQFLTAMNQIQEQLIKERS